MKAEFPDGLRKLTIELDPDNRPTRFLLHSTFGCVGVGYGLTTLRQIHEHIGQIIAKMEAAQ